MIEKNLLIIDDEQEILSWLEEMFRYDFGKKLGVYTAKSGAEALKLLNQVKFEVVLTDIHMPKMDGITLFYKIKENWPRCKTVFLTGYQNFEDVYQIFQHRDVRYILKSESDEKIKQAVWDALEEFDQELENEKARVLQKQKEENVTLFMRRQMFREALEGKISRKQLEQYAAELDFSMDVLGEMLLYYIRMDKEIQGDDAETQMRICEAMNRLLAENMSEKLAFFVCPQTKRNYFLFVQPKDKAEGNWKEISIIAQGALEYVMEVFKSSHELSFSVVTDITPVKLEKMVYAALRMKQMMVAYVGKNREVFLYEEPGDLQKTESDSSVNSIITRIPMLKSYLELVKEKEYFALLEECTSGIKGRSAHDVYAMELYYSVATLLLQFINANNMYQQLAFKTGLYKLMKIDEHENWYAAVGYLYDISGYIFELLKDKEAGLTERALNRVIKYIDDNISEDLSLTALAQIGGFNASYLSRLFSQSCNQTVTDYIFDKRMKKAKELLRDTDKKILQISREIGYVSAKSFARAFRSSEGISPVEYRELHRHTV